MKLHLPSVLFTSLSLGSLPVSTSVFTHDVTSDEPCINTLDLKKAFAFEIGDCEHALVMETVTYLRKNTDPICPHDSGVEVKLLAESVTGEPVTTEEEAKIILAEFCENTKAEFAAEDFTGIEPGIMGLFPLTLHGCSSELILAKLEEGCFCNSTASLMEALGIEDQAILLNNIESACTYGWKDLQYAEWNHINPSLDDTTIGRYFEGGTALNYETGNLGRDNQVPRYPTDEYTLDIADSVKGWFENGNVQDAPMGNPPGLEKCELSSIMCCFGRDRQSNDNNGSCNQDWCENSHPGDNSNLCFKEFRTEGDIHCHGLAWSENDNDVSSILKMNNLFFVSLYDHWYTRGYVENSLESEKSFTEFPMCGCMEDMPAVTRADCTEVSVEYEFTIDHMPIADGGSLTVPFTAVPADQRSMGVKFNSCTGVTYQDPNANGRGNDLSTHINRLVKEKKMSEETRMTIFENHLVGYEDPNDRENDFACEQYMNRNAYFNPTPAPTVEPMEATIISAFASSQRQAASRAIDGNPHSRWESDFQIDPQWLTLDMGEVIDLLAIKIYWEAACATDYEVQVRDTDEGVWTTAFSIQDSPNCRGRHYEEWVDLTGFKGRYIRIYGTSRFLSCCGYSIFETTVYVPDEEIV